MPVSALSRGAGEAEGGLAERGRGAVTGGLIGAAAGGFGVPLLEAGIAGGRYLARKPIEIARSVYNPTGQASRALGRTYAEAFAADPAAARRLDLAQMGVGPGQEAVAMDVLGQPGRNLARSAANLSGEARDVLEQTLEPRTAGQSERFTDWFRQWSNYPDVYSAQEAIDVAEHGFEPLQLRPRHARRATCRCGRPPWSSSPARPRCSAP